MNMKLVDFNVLFDQQVRTLLWQGCPDAAGMKEEQFLRCVEPLGREISEIGQVPDGYIPFLIVIPDRFVPLRKQMAMLRRNGGAPSVSLNPDALKNAEGVVTKPVPYLIFDVESGAATRGAAPGECVKRFRQEGRCGLTVEEGMALVTHFPETLGNHYIDLPGSRYYSDRVPDLWLCDSEPMLSFSWVDLANALWGSASCGRRS